MQACRNELINLLADRRQIANPGLVLSRYLQHSAKEQSEFRKARDTLYCVALREASENVATLYRMAYDRRCNLMKDQSEILALRGRLIVGLGGASPVETGITLHHAYGVPVIPGSALKGLAAHYCNQVRGAADPRFKKPVSGGEDEKTACGEVFNVLFGTSEDAGHIIFHDAWLDPDCLTANNKGFVLDVITPHHGDYYSSDPDNVTPPTDFDDPNPIPFLAVAGEFHFAVSCDSQGADAEKWTQLAFDLLKEALANWGVGGKTNSGYGRMVKPDAVDANPPAIRNLPPSIAPPPVPPPGPAKVQVTFLEPHSTLNSAFWVQEPDKRKGLVKYGKRPDPLPSPGQQIQVYPTNISPNCLEYRWDPPPAAPPQRGHGPRGRR